MTPADAQGHRGCRRRPRTLLRGARRRALRLRRQPVRLARHRQAARGAAADRVWPPATSAAAIAVGGANGAFSTDGCAVRIAGSNDRGIAGGTTVRHAPFAVRANLSLCGAAIRHAAPDLVASRRAAARRAAGHRGSKRTRATNPMFAPLRQAMLTAETLLKQNAGVHGRAGAGADAHVAVGRPARDAGARMHVKATPERKPDGTRLWSTGRARSSRSSIASAARSVRSRSSSTRMRADSSSTRAACRPKLTGPRLAAIPSTTAGWSSRRMGGCRGFRRRLAEQARHGRQAPARRAGRLAEEPSGHEGAGCRGAFRRPTRCSRRPIRPAPTSSSRR